MKKTNKKEMEKDLEVKEKDLQEKEVLEEMSEVHKKKLDKLIDETVNHILGEENQEKVFTNITKLKCDYTVYKRERTKCNMPVEAECARCGKKFKEGDELYIANNNGKNYIICSKCANKGE